MSHDPSTTAILLIDPHNDFLSEGGKLRARAKAIAEEVKLLDLLRAPATRASRSTSCRITAGNRGIM